MAAGAKPEEPLLPADGAAIGSFSKVCNKLGAKRVAKLVASILFPFSTVPRKVMRDDVKLISCARETVIDLNY